MFGVGLLRVQAESAIVGIPLNLQVRVANLNVIILLLTTCTSSRIEEDMTDDVLVAAFEIPCL